MKYVKNILDGNPDELEIKNRKLAYEAACEGIVLLKNDGVLPLKDRHVALYGAGASRTIKGGLGSGEVNERYSVSILEGLENNGFIIKNKKWINDYEVYYNKTREVWRATIKKQLTFFKIITGNLDGVQTTLVYDNGRAVSEEDCVDTESDTAIYVVARQSGEGEDRKIDKGENDLQKEELQSLRLLKKHFKNVILIINSGCSINLNTIDSLDLNAIIFFGQQGEEGGNALASILLGERCPCGKLTTTWAENYDDIPYAQEYSYLKGNTGNEYYKESIYVGYRYFDSFKKAVRYPFGFGLSYTEFEQKFVSLKLNKTQAEVEVKVTNVGNVAGKEVVQLYVSLPQGRLGKEYQRLATFEKTQLLQPKQSETIKLVFDITSLTSYDTQSASYILEAGNYIIRIGNSSRNTNEVAILHLGKETVVSKHDNICPTIKTFERLVCNLQDEQPDVPVYEIDAENIVCEKTAYKKCTQVNDSTVAKIVNGLSLKELAKVVCGAGYMEFPIHYVPGYTGLTTTRLYKKGVPNATLSDGPAGIRLPKRSALTKKGGVKMYDYQFEFLEFMPKLLKAFIVGNEKKDRLLYQYCTAIPVAICIAQTWNKQLIKDIGRGIGEEMEKYGVTYWLAPALNIIRNPLCGRNFEYYSEDPVLSGTIAASIINGVNTIKGKYPTIKHFACNNQEDNRQYTSSNVDERALREIYLKGFEIVIKQVKKTAVMSSYNLVNGVYAANSYDLLTKILRNEWGFDGVVMSDWYSTKDSCASTDKAIAAGNDLIMPGGKEYVKKIVKAVKNGSLSIEDLKISASRVLKDILSADILSEKWFNGKELYRTK